VFREEILSHVLFFFFCKTNNERWITPFYASYHGSPRYHYRVLYYDGSHGVDGRTWDYSLMVTSYRRCDLLTFPKGLNPILRVLVVRNFEGHRRSSAASMSPSMSHGKHSNTTHHSYHIRSLAGLVWSVLHVITPLWS
jgi:hypothetical protein